MLSASPPAKRRKPNRKPLQNATVVRTATDDQKISASTVDKKILERIQKCLDRAEHPNTAEAEAKAALFVSQKLMNQHNVSQADLIANDTNNNKSHFGGRSIVLISKIGGSSTRIAMEAFTGKVASAMTTLYDCKSFSTNYGTHIHWTFFGIADNTDVAARAFAVAHNKILEWACDYKGGTPTFSYRLGVADGLKAMAYREKKRELHHAERKALEMAKARERQDADTRQREIDRLRILPAPSPDPNDFLSFDDENEIDSGDIKPSMVDTGARSDSDEESGPFDINADFNSNDAEVIDLCDDDDVDDYIRRFVKQEPVELSIQDETPVFKTEPDVNIKPKPEVSSLDQSPWDSGVQLVQFRNTAAHVADDYLQEQNIKLTSGRKRPLTIGDRDAYRRGQQDSEKIDVRREALV
ncbi:hypothetical protein N7490_000926 [Penicillium lividum]|nr:hypothetical protein N7490_000926 [Penicillium lividum]